MSAEVPDVISEEIQALSLGPMVTLFAIDLTALGGGVYRLCSSADSGSPVVFDGETYALAAVEATGFSVTGEGSLPTPTLRIGNTDFALSSLIEDYDDLVGAEVQRIRTFQRFLDGEPDADPTAVLPIDYFRIDRLAGMNNVMAEFTLAAAIDAEGVKLPGRRIIREVCTHSYRTWDAASGSFDYTRVSCPYTDTASFNEVGAPVGTSEDRCGKRLPDCRLRFGENGVLPTRKFPGVGGFSV